jgi:hypothetical protein
MLNLESNGFATASSAVVRSGVWEACTGANLRGQCTRLQPGEYRDVNTLLSDDVASVREIVLASAVAPSAVVVGSATISAPVMVAPTRQPHIVLFEKTGFGGSSFELTKTMGGLDRSALYPGADAAIVDGGVWRLCTRQYFRGECADFAPGRYADLGPLTGRVSSAEVVSGTVAPVSVLPAPPSTGRVVLYELPDFGGQSVVLNQSEVPDLELVSFNARAASMQVEGGTWMFCTDTAFHGECLTLRPGQYARLPRDVDRRIVSARPVIDVYGRL